ncbi:hypothetical protein HF521_018942 [Silurus meridionalis]|uniref:Chemokine interleukin-8-like domain-containing protein n=1 Tax=Silurus meridionalis TaxID=175797 RepID=A0A8T0BKZ4_SILME|nr:hypothetical protein HF521_018942 [Silurus meridionalis]
MRNLTALLFVLSLCSLHLVFSGPVSFEYKNHCCSKTSNTKIPLNNIVTYRRTSSSCPMKAIVFETIKGKQLCVDPSVSWVKSHMKAVDRRNKATSTP